MNGSISGNFKRYIEGLIEQKNAMGYPYKTSGQILKAFSIFCIDHYPDEITLTQKMAMQWAEQRPHEHINRLLRRITPVRQLAKYMNQIDVAAYIIPAGIPGKLVQYIPHIFTDQELHAFFAAIDQCAFSSHSPARHLVIPVFFRLLYCCGLRSSEARLLKVEDVDLENGKIAIRHAKCSKDRNVMMSEDVLQLCQIYHSRVSRIFPDRVAFFPNSHGQHYHNSMIGYWFHLFWKKTRLTNLSSGNPPRVHDFRHTYAVKRLNLWVQEGKDINAYLPYLSVYLGHAHLAATDYYLHFVPEFFPVFKERTLEKCAHLIPEVNHEA
ncbi:tyrosine-type recombinase/integrase [bacterium]|nr:tyrosine-type recombinase/integrase [bacterium]